MRRAAQVERGSERGASSINARGRGRGRVRIAVIGRGEAGVGRDHNRRSRLSDAISDRSGTDVVVVGAAVKAPVIGRIRTGVCVGSVGHLNRSDGVPCLAVHPGNRRHSRCVFMAVICRGQAGVGRDHNRRSRLTDAIGDRRVADIVVVGGASEEPVVAGIRAGVGVRRVAHVHAPYRRICFAVHTGDQRHGRGVRVTIVCRGQAGVGRDYN